MVNSVLVILFVLLQLCVRVCGLLWQMVKAAAWLAVVPLWDGVVLTIACLMWFCGGLAGAELPKLQLGRYGFLTFQWEDLYGRQYSRACR